MPLLNGGWQHNYSTKTMQAGNANEQSMYSQFSMGVTKKASNKLAPWVRHYHGASRQCPHHFLSTSRLVNTSDFEVHICITFWTSQNGSECNIGVCDIHQCVCCIHRYCTLTHFWRSKTQCINVLQNLMC